MNQKKKLTDLLKDASFLRWLRAGRPGSDPDWNAWSKEEPNNEQLAEDAAAMEQGVPFRRQAVSDELTQQNWEGIQTRLAQEDGAGQRRQLLRWSAAAAVLLLLSAFAVQWWGGDASWTNHQTAAGEYETIDLPDGTTIYLGANSNLQYQTAFLSKDERLIYLEGEAYFEVQPQEDPMPFLVQTPALNVRVLGTQFNVNAHRAEPIVSLTSGSLQVIYPDGDATKILEPGQTAQYDVEKKQFNISEDVSDYWASWRAGKWEFGAGMPMTEVIQRIEEIYGLKCIVSDPAILQRKPAGRVFIDDREELFSALSSLLKVTFTVQGNELHIQQSEN
ncbi:MAG: FecR domain-containing protein [Bacteroidota bacterium]